MLAKLFKSEGRSGGREPDLRDFKSMPNLSVVRRGFAGGCRINMIGDLLSVAAYESTKGRVKEAVERWALRCAKANVSGITPKLLNRSWRWRKRKSDAGSAGPRSNARGTEMIRRGHWLRGKSSPLKCALRNSSIRRPVTCFPYVESTRTPRERNRDTNHGDEQATHRGISRA